MKFGSVCSGIEAASVAWEPLGWKAAWLSEIEPFPCAVLKHHYPDVLNLGDMTALPDCILSGEVEAPDLFCGGTPCQAFSVAGLRKSLNDARGNLCLTFCEIANAIDHIRAARGELPAIIFWENVPGVLSTKDNAFGCFLAGLVGDDEPAQAPDKKWKNSGVVVGPERLAVWRVLDAQYFGVAQRRRRVFVLSVSLRHPRAWLIAESLLPLSKGVRGDTAPSRKAGQNPAPTIAGCFNGGGANGPGRDENSTTIAVLQPIAWTSDGQTADPITAHESRTYTQEGTNNFRLHNCVQQTMAVRRLTPVECERLQGFPDNYTNIPKRVISDYGVGPCAKQVVKATVVAANGTHFVATNHCDTPQSSCARAGMPTGQGYELCKNVCNQRAHAEVNAIALAGKHAQGAILHIEGHTYACTHCAATAEAAGIKQVVIGKPLGTSPDGPRYKALGNSWAVPVVQWIGSRIKAALSSNWRLHHV